MEFKLEANFTGDEYSTFDVKVNFKEKDLNQVLSHLSGFLKACGYPVDGDLVFTSKSR